MVFRSPNPPQRTEGSRSAPRPQLDEAFTIFIYDLRLFSAFHIVPPWVLHHPATHYTTAYDMLISTSKSPNLLKTSDSSGRSIIAKVLSSFVSLIVYTPQNFTAVRCPLFRSLRYHHGTALRRFTFETFVYWARSLCFFVLPPQDSTPTTVTHHPFPSLSYFHYICVTRFTRHCWGNGKMRTLGCASAATAQKARCGLGDSAQKAFATWCFIILVAKLMALVLSVFFVDWRTQLASSSAMELGVFIEAAALNQLLLRLDHLMSLNISPCDC